MFTFRRSEHEKLADLYINNGNLQILGQDENEHIEIISGGETVTMKLKDGNWNNYGLKDGDLWVIAGQSNCGRTRVSEMTQAQRDEYAVEFTNVKIMNQYVSKTTYANMHPGVNTMLVNANNTDEFGFEASFFKRINELAVNKYFLVKHGYGASSLYTQWNPTYDPLELYFKAMVNRISQAGANALQEGIQLRLRGFIWMQGEQDATLDTASNLYFENLLMHFAYFDWGLKKIIKDGRLTQDSLRYKPILCKIKRFDGQYEDRINQAFVDYAALTYNNASLVETDDLPLKDSIHFNATGQIELGNRIFEKAFI